MYNNISDIYLCITSYKLRHEKKDLTMPGSLWLCVMEPSPSKNKKEKIT
jgi:hypothetical protein